MSELSYFRVEATLGGIWQDLSDDRFVPAADGFFSGSTKSKRRIVTQSPVLDGDYLISVTSGDVVEGVKFWVHGRDQVDLAENYSLLEDIFDQFDFRMRITFDNFQETWVCKASDYTIERSHTLTHNCMAAFSAQVPRAPGVSRVEL